MILCLIFEMTGALAVGARTASTIKNGIIPISAFENRADVQLLAFACASAGAAIWVMWCTRHSAHVSSTYSLVSSIAGVGVATVGASGVQWGWNKGQGLGAIFSGLVMAPFCAAAFGAIIFMLVKVVVHMRANPVPWAVWTSPFFFLIAGTVCALSVVYKGSPRLGLDKKPAWYIASVSLGTGFGLFVLAAIFFVPFVHARVVKLDNTMRWYDIWQGPLLFKRPAPENGFARVRNYAVIQKEGHSGHDSDSTDSIQKVEATGEKGQRADDIEPVSETPREKSHSLEEAAVPRNPNEQYKILLARARAEHHAELRTKRGPLGWAMRVVHNNPMGAGSIYELHNLKALAIRMPAYCVIALTYGLYYDIHRAQVGIEGTPEGRRMKRVYAYAKKYPNEVEHLYSFVQIITACTASFAHGANDVGNAVGVWAAMYAAWSTGTATAAKAEVPLWQIAVTALTICIGFITYGYNIMKGKLTSPFPPYKKSHRILTIS
jgi:solute carrier family 20 (sodium-dependent phosphate transporter)